MVKNSKQESKKEALTRLMQDERMSRATRLLAEAKLWRMRGRYDLAEKVERMAEEAE